MTTKPDDTTADDATDDVTEQPPGGDEDLFSPQRIRSRAVPAGADAEQTVAIVAAIRNPDADRLSIEDFTGVQRNRVAYAVEVTSIGGDFENRRDTDALKRREGRQVTHYDDLTKKQRCIVDYFITNPGHLDQVRGGDADAEKRRVTADAVAAEINQNAKYGGDETVSQSYVRKVATEDWADEIIETRRTEKGLDGIDGEDATPRAVSFDTARGTLDLPLPKTNLDDLPDNSAKPRSGKDGGGSSTSDGGDSGDILSQISRDDGSHDDEVTDGHFANGASDGADADETDSDQTTTETPDDQMTTTQTDATDDSGEKTGDQRDQFGFDPDPTEVKVADCWRDGERYEVAHVGGRLVAPKAIRDDVATVKVEEGNNRQLQKRRPYYGVVNGVESYGIFVSLTNPRGKHDVSGLVHVNRLDSDPATFSPGDQVIVKLNRMKPDGPSLYLIRRVDDAKPVTTDTGDTTDDEQAKEHEGATAKYDPDATSDDETDAEDGSDETDDDADTGGPKYDPGKPTMKPTSSSGVHDALQYLDGQIRSLEEAVYAADDGGDFTPASALRGDDVDAVDLDDQEAFADLVDDVSSLRRDWSDTVQRLGDAEDELGDHATRLADLVDSLDDLADRVDDLEMDSGTVKTVEDHEGRLSSVESRQRGTQDDVAAALDRVGHLEDRIDGKALRNLDEVADLEERLSARLDTLEADLNDVQIPESAPKGVADGGSDGSDPGGHAPGTTVQVDPLAGGDFDRLIARLAQLRAQGYEVEHANDSDAEGEVTLKIDLAKTDD